MSMTMTWMNPVVTFKGPAGEVTLNLTEALKATMFERSVTRNYTVKDFTVGRVLTVNWGATPAAGLAPESYRVE